MEQNTLIGRDMSDGAYVSPLQRSEFTAYERFLIFLHIQKCAGLTFQRLLRRNFGPPLLTRAARLVFTPIQLQRPLINTMRSQRMKDRYFVGHVCYGVHRHLPHPYAYICFLREPIDRLLSLYRYSRHNSTAYYHRQASTMSPDDFFSHSGLMELDNGQVRIVAGDDDDPFINRTRYGDVGSTLLEKATSNIERDFAFVGIVEAFDASLLLMQECIQLRRIFYLPRNRGARHWKEMPSDKVLQDLSELNQYDYQLYHLMRQRLTALQQQQVAFDAQLRKFQILNRMFQLFTLRPYNAYDRLKARFRGQAGRPI